MVDGPIGSAVACPNDTGDFAEEKKTIRTWLEKAGLDEKPHQTSGILWACARERCLCDLYQGKAGGIIADEMGLGKTIVMIGLMLANFKRRTLIVVPVALLQQWETEIERLTGHSPLVFHGYRKTKISSEQFLEAPIIITTYGMVAQKKRNPLHLIEWDRLVFDEAHHLRNQKQTHASAMRLKSTATWLMTGTPIQNDVSDLNALWKMLKVKVSFTELYIGDGSVLRHLLSIYMLRRTKAEVGLELPPVVEEVVSVPWESGAERDLCEELHSALQFSMSEAQQGPITEELTRHVLAALVRCRQSCVKPGLLKDAYDAVVGDLEREGEEDPIEEGFLNKSKINAVVKKIQERSAPKSPRRQKLVFSHYRGEIDEIVKQLSMQSPELKVAFFDGRVGAREREMILEDDVDILILQIKTACEGLNLQQFKEVYMVTPHWNPAVEDQAVARCHRIGQTETINVFRFVMENFGLHTKTIDAYCQDVQEKKREFCKILETP